MNKEQIQELNQQQIQLLTKEQIQSFQFFDIKIFKKINDRWDEQTFNNLQGGPSNFDIYYIAEIPILLSNNNVNVTHILTSSAIKNVSLNYNGNYLLVQKEKCSVLYDYKFKMTITPTTNQLDFTSSSSEISAYSLKDSTNLVTNLNTIKTLLVIGNTGPVGPVLEIKNSIKYLSNYLSTSLSNLTALKQNILTLEEIKKTTDTTKNEITNLSDKIILNYNNMITNVLYIKSNPAYYNFNNIRKSLNMMNIILLYIKQKITRVKDKEGVYMKIDATKDTSDNYYDLCGIIELYFDNYDETFVGYLKSSNVFFEQGTPSSTYANSYPETFFTGASSWTSKGIYLDYRWGSSTESYDSAKVKEANIIKYKDILIRNFKAISLFYDSIDLTTTTGFDDLVPDIKPYVNEIENLSDSTKLYIKAIVKYTIYGYYKLAQDLYQACAKSLMDKVYDDNNGHDYIEKNHYATNNGDTAYLYFNTLITNLEPAYGIRVTHEPILYVKEFIFYLAQLRIYFKNYGSSLDKFVPIISSPSFMEPNLKSSQTISNITHVGYTATLTVDSPHGLITGNEVTIKYVSPDDYNGTFIITVTDSNTFTYVMSGSGPSSDAVSLDGQGFYGLYTFNYKINDIKTYEEYYTFTEYTLMKTFYNITNQFIDKNIENQVTELNKLTDVITASTYTSATGFSGTDTTKFVTANILFSYLLNCEFATIRTIFTSFINNFSTTKYSSKYQPSLLNSFTINGSTTSFVGNTVSISKNLIKLLDGYITNTVTPDETETIAGSAISGDGNLFIILTSSELKVYKIGSTIPFITKEITNAINIQCSYDANVIACNCIVDTITYKCIIYKIFMDSYKSNTIELDNYKNIVLSKCGNILIAYKSSSYRLYIWNPYVSKEAGKWILYSTYYIDTSQISITNNNYFMYSIPILKDTKYYFQILKMFNNSSIPIVKDIQFTKPSGNPNNNLSFSIFQPNKIEDSQIMGYEIIVNNSLHSKLYLNEVGFSTFKNKTLIYDLIGIQKFPEIFYDNQTTPENIFLYNKLLNYYKIFSNKSTFTLNNIGKNEYTNDNRKRIKSLVASVYLDNVISQLSNSGFDNEKSPSTVTYNNSFENMMKNSSIRYAKFVELGTTCINLYNNKIDVERYYRLKSFFDQYFIKIKEDSKKNINYIDIDIPNIIKNGTVQFFSSSDFNTIINNAIAKTNNTPSKINSDTFFYLCKYNTKFAYYYEKIKAYRLCNQSNQTLSPIMFEKIKDILNFDIFINILKNTEQSIRNNYIDELYNKFNSVRTTIDATYVLEVWINTNEHNFLYGKSYDYFLQIPKHILKLITLEKLIFLHTKYVVNKYKNLYEQIIQLNTIPEEIKTLLNKFNQKWGVNADGTKFKFDVFNNISFYNSMKTDISFILNSLKLYQTTIDIIDDSILYEDQPAQVGTGGYIQPPTVDILNYKRLYDDKINERFIINKDTYTKNEIRANIGTLRSIIDLQTQSAYYVLPTANVSEITQAKQGLLYFKYKLCEYILNDHNLSTLYHNFFKVAYILSYLKTRTGDLYFNFVSDTYLNTVLSIEEKDFNNLDTIIATTSLNYQLFYNEISTKITSDSYFSSYYFYSTNYKNKSISLQPFENWLDIYKALDMTKDIVKNSIYYDQSKIFAFEMLLKSCSVLIKNNYEISQPLTIKYNRYMSQAENLLYGDQSSDFGIQTVKYYDLVKSVITAQDSIDTKITGQKFSYYDFYMYKYTVVEGAIQNRSIGVTEHPIEHLIQTEMVATEYKQDILNAINYFKSKHQFNDNYLSYVHILNKIIQFIGFMDKCSTVSSPYFNILIKSSTTISSFDDLFLILQQYLATELNKYTTDTTTNSSIKIKLDNLRRTKLSKLTSAIDTMKKNLETVKDLLTAQAETEQEAIDDLDGDTVKGVAWGKSLLSVASLGTADPYILAYDIGEIVYNATNTYLEVTEEEQIEIDKTAIETELENDELPTNDWANGSDNTTSVSMISNAILLETTLQSTAFDTALDIATGKATEKIIKTFVGRTIAKQTATVIEKKAAISLKKTVAKVVAKQTAKKAAKAGVKAAVIAAALATATATGGLSLLVVAGFAVFDVVTAHMEVDQEIARRKQSIKDLTAAKTEINTLSTDLDKSKASITTVIGLDTILSETDSTAEDDLRYILNMTIEKMETIRNRVNDFTCYTYGGTSRTILEKSFKLYTNKYKIDVSTDLSTYINSNSASAKANLIALLTEQKSYLNEFNTIVDGNTSGLDKLFKGIYDPSSSRTVSYIPLDSKKDKDTPATTKSWVQAYGGNNKLNFTSHMNLKTYLENLSGSSYKPSEFIEYLRKTPRSHWDLSIHLHFLSGNTLSIEEKMFGTSDETEEFISRRFYTYYVIIKILAFSIRDLLRRIKDEDDDTSDIEAPNSQYPALFIKLDNLIKMVTAFTMTSLEFSTTQLLTTDLYIKYDANSLTDSYKLKMYRFLLNKTVNYFDSTIGAGITDDEISPYIDSTFDTSKLLLTNSTEYNMELVMLESNLLKIYGKYLNKAYTNIDTLYKSQSSQYEDSTDWKIIIAIANKINGSDNQITQLLKYMLEWNDSSTSTSTISQIVNYKNTINIIDIIENELDSVDITPITISGLNLDSNLSITYLNVNPTVTINGIEDGLISFTVNSYTDGRIKKYGYEIKNLLGSIIQTGTQFSGTSFTISSNTFNPNIIHILKVSIENDTNKLYSTSLKFNLYGQPTDITILPPIEYTTIRPLLISYILIFSSFKNKFFILYNTDQYNGQAEHPNLYNISQNSIINIYLFLSNSTFQSFPTSFINFNFIFGRYLYDKIYYEGNGIIRFSVNNSLKIYGNDISEVQPIFSKIDDKCFIKFTHTKYISEFCLYENKNNIDILIKNMSNDIISVVIDCEGLNLYQGIREIKQYIITINKDTSSFIKINQFQTPNIWCCYEKYSHIGQYIVYPEFSYQKDFILKIKQKINNDYLEYDDVTYLSTLSHPTKTIFTANINITYTYTFITDHDRLIINLSIANLPVLSFTEEVYQCLIFNQMTKLEYNIPSNKYIVTSTHLLSYIKALNLTSIPFTIYKASNYACDNLYKYDGSVELRTDIYGSFTINIKLNTPTALSWGESRKNPIIKFAYNDSTDFSTDRFEIVFKRYSLDQNTLLETITNYISYKDALITKIYGIFNIPLKYSIENFMYKFKIRTINDIIGLKGDYAENDNYIKTNSTPTLTSINFSTPNNIININYVLKVNYPQICQVSFYARSSNNVNGQTNRYDKKYYHLCVKPENFTYNNVELNYYFNGSSALSNLIPNINYIISMKAENNVGIYYANDAFTTQFTNIIEIPRYIILTTILTSPDLSAINNQTIDISGYELKDLNLDGIDLSKTILQNVKSSGLSGNPILPINYTLIDGYLIGPYVDLSQVAFINRYAEKDLTLSNVDLSGAIFKENVEIYLKCSNVFAYEQPINISCPFGGYMLAPHVNLNGADLRFLEYDSVPISRFRGLKTGRLIINEETSLPNKYYVRGLADNQLPLGGLHIIGPNADLSNANFAGSLTNFVDISGIDISGVNFSGANLTYVKSGNNRIDSETFCQKVEIDNELYDDHIFNKGVQLRYTNLDRLNFSNIDISNVDFTGSTFINSTFDNIILTGCDFTDTNTETIASMFSSQSSGNMKPLNKILQSGTTLNGFVFNKYTISNGYLLGIDIDFTNTDLSTVDIQNVDLSNCFINNTKFGYHPEYISTKLKLPVGYYLRNGYIFGKNIDCRGYNLQRANIIYDLSNINLTGSNFTGVDFKNTILSNTDFTDCILDYIKSGNINLNMENSIPPIFSVSSKLKFISGYIIGPKVDLSGANFKGINFRNIDIPLELINTLSEIEISSLTENQRLDIRKKLKITYDLFVIKLDASSLSNINIACLSNEEIKLLFNVSNNQLKFLSVSQLNSFTPSQLEVFTIEQMTTFNQQKILPRLKMTIPYDYTGIISNNIVTDSFTQLPDHVSIISGYFIAPKVDLTNAVINNQDLTGVILSNATLKGLRSSNIKYSQLNPPSF